jgi:predicted aspartyl protease
LNSALTPELHTLGLYLKARIDGGPDFRMLLDSGAQHVVLGRKSAARIGRKDGAPFDLVGVGGAVKSCSRSTRGTVRIAGLTFEDCDILIVDGQLPEGIDGVIPMSLFEGFLVRLDMAA